MTEEWIMTQNGAVRKSEINMILLQQNQNNKINVVLVTKDKFTLLVYNDVENPYHALIGVDNLITQFDPNHVPQIILKKKEEEEQEEEQEQADEEEIIEPPQQKTVQQTVKPPVKPAVKQQPKQKVEVPPSPTDEAE